MPTVFIDDNAGHVLAVPLPARCAEGDVIDKATAELLNNILHRRVKAKLRWLLQRGEIARADVAAKAIELCNQPMVAYATLDDSDDHDPILIEALAIAREAFVTHWLASSGALPLPKDLETHVKAIVDGSPVILERARKRVEARYTAMAIKTDE